MLNKLKRLINRIRFRKYLSGRLPTKYLHISKSYYCANKKRVVSKSKTYEV